MNAASLLNGLYRLGYRSASGIFRLRNRILHPAVTGAGVLVWRGDELLVVSQSYRNWTTTPGGRVERDEAPSAAAARELGEEVGLHADPLELVPVAVIELDHNHMLDTVHFFSWRFPAEATLLIDQREIVDARFVRPDAVLEEELWPPLRALLERGIQAL